MKSLRHVGIVVKDIDKALYFYCNLLGLKVVKKTNETGNFIDTICGFKNISVTTVKLATDDASMIELLYFTAPKLDQAVAKKLNCLGFSHISFTVKDIAQEYDRLTKAGVKFNSLPQVSCDGLAKVVFCQDSEGNFVELVEEIKINEGLC